ncbi:unnamed protein product [Symbiodinium microadriaticum]|nr:unnamed protein product [Symbiodinium microadriaticum]
MSGCHINRVPGRRAACVLAVLIWQCRPCGFAETGAALDKRVRGRFVSARPRQPRLQTLVGRAASAGEEVEGLLLEEKLGAGSFGTTWKATVSELCEVPDLSPGQKVALKLVRLEEGWTTLDKFERESSVLQRLRHPAVPSYYGSVVRDRPNGQDFGLVCNIVNGNTLEEELRSGRWVATVDNIKLLAETLLEVCVHLASFAPPIVHRDIKPQNILLEAMAVQRSIEYCLQSQNIAPNDISIVAHGWLFGGEDLTKRLAAEPVEVQKHMRWMATKFRDVDLNVEARLRSGLQALGIPEARLQMYDHHSCHAAAAFFAWPARLTADCCDCCCVTLDGRGDYASGKIVKFLEKPAVLDETSMFDSLGMLWAFVTASLGFKAFRHEGKLTGAATLMLRFDKGLAAHGDGSRTARIFEKVMGLVEDGGLWRIRAAAAPPEGCRRGIAMFKEDLLLGYLRLNNFVKPYICVAGGVFANVRLNLRLRQHFQVFVYPNMGDAGLCFGAAALAASDAGKAVFSWDPTSLPRDLADLRSCVDLFAEHMPACPAIKIGGSEISDLEGFAAEVAAYLARGKVPALRTIFHLQRCRYCSSAWPGSGREVVGLYVGAMEFGPRALGHRSLLASATDPAINSDLTLGGKYVKLPAYSDFPVEDCETVVLRYDEVYVRACYEATPELKNMCPAVVHVDNTVRPQVVDERDGLAYHVLVHYEAKTGVHSLINTSFNMHEDPIVCTPKDAMHAFEKGACDASQLCAGSFPFLDLDDNVSWRQCIIWAVSTDDTPTSWRTYLVDFGSAVLGSGTRTAEGTFGYMAPESFGRVFTPKSDLYSVGATLLYAATGLEPGTLPQERLKVKFRPAFVGTVWERQERWFLKLLEGLLEPAPEDRFSSAAEALSFLRQPVTEVLPLGQPTASNSVAKNQATLQSRTEVTLEPPRGSRISVDRRGEELRVLLPPARWESRVSLGTFGIAWTTFTAVWTAGVIAAGASFMALFSLPFWVSGAGMLKETFGPLLRGAAELQIRGDRWKFCRVDGKVLEEGRTADLQCLVLTNGTTGGKDVVLEEGLVSVKVQEGLPEVEAEWLQALIEKHIERYK